MYSSRALFSFIFFYKYFFVPFNFGINLRPNIILIVTGVSHYWKWSPRLSSTVIKRLKDNGVTTLISWGHVTSSVTWPFDSWWFIVTMRLSGSVMKIWPFEFLPKKLFQEQRSVVGRSVLSITLTSYTPLLFATLGT